jgi:hypothetical protein
MRWGREKSLPLLSFLKEFSEESCSLSFYSRYPGKTDGSAAAEAEGGSWPPFFVGGILSSYHYPFITHPASPAFH